ncbi:hypothetical protein Moror_10149 [Moniliophthora roreri MCA 2997]|uniref:DUF6533 domain-containing protein n=1 Tax=Moniliophthora roreri (strain MCA 2997) TaxID=1381753 RepID=V2WV20_MONRO|nr:hypothetical protein Moror_10149 [Moniliophthora roreri MCA 2997]
MDVSALESELRASAYLKASCLTVLIYDWVITFSHEVDYIWGSRWNIVKVLYLFIRYTSVIDTVLALQGRTEEPQICNDHRATFNTRKYSKLYPRFIR